jgi:putative tryptophan/tyrosine transport system substrate-binding protein
MFRSGLEETGYVEGQNVTIEYRWAENQYDRLPGLAADLVRRRVSVIVASGGPVTPTAAKAATSTIPIVFTATSDPVKLGLVASLSRPHGNVTGTSAFTVELDAKRMEVLREMVPAARVIGAFVNPTRTDADAQSRAVEDAARALSWEVRILNAESEADIDAAFARVLELKISALVVGADPFFNSHRVKGQARVRVRCAGSNGPALLPSLALLKLYIYGYLNRVQSSRRLERGWSQSRGDLASRLIGPG